MGTYRVWQHDYSDNFGHPTESVLVEAKDWIQALRLGIVGAQPIRLLALHEARFFAMDLATGKVYGMAFA